MGRPIKRSGAVILPAVAAAAGRHAAALYNSPNASILASTQPIPMLGVWELWMRRAGVWVWQCRQDSEHRPLLLDGFLCFLLLPGPCADARPASHWASLVRASTSPVVVRSSSLVLLTHPPTHKHSHTHRNHGERLNIDTRVNAFAAPSRGLGRLVDRLCCAWAANNANNASSSASFAYVACVVVQSSIDRSIDRSPTR